MGRSKSNLGLFSYKVKPLYLSLSICCKQAILRRHFDQYTPIRSRLFVHFKLLSSHLTYPLTSVLPDVYIFAVQLFECLVIYLYIVYRLVKLSCLAISVRWIWIGLSVGLNVDRHPTKLKLKRNNASNDVFEYFSRI